jgi:aspartokinase/homoserine dehydrogenase 1
MAGRGPRGVHKFGGTSVQSAEAMQQVRQIITGIAAELGDGSPLAVVVSAMGGKPKVTDLLIETVSLAAAGELDAAKAILAQIRAKHEAAMGELFVEPVHAAEAATLARELHADLADIEHLLRAVSLMRAKDQRLVGVISGYGEQWSARMMAALLRCTRTPPAAANWVYLDARSVLVVDESISTGVAIIWDESARRLDAFVRAHAGASMVITGFIASTRDGGITTLGRDGSDYSASVFGRLFEAESVTIWTDVSGVLSADPRVVADAYVLPEVSYNEAAELAHFGAKVVHPKTMQPALARLDWRPDARSIPIHIRNTFAPRDRGTRIYETSPLTTSREVCGVSAMDGMCLVNVMGRGMVGIPGVASRLFNALHSLGVNVTAIAQASSEQSISVALQQTDGGRAQAAVREVFRHELHAGHIEDVQLVPDVTIIAVVGDGMSRSPGVAGKVMSALGQAGVNIRAIAQGCNETNITTIVDGRQSLRALRAVHSAFLASLTVAVGVVARSGPVASELLCSFERHGPTAQARFGLNAQVLALCKLAEAGEAPAQRGRLLARDQQAAPDLSAWARALADGDATGARADGDDAGAAADLAAFTEAMLAADVPMRVVIDASDSALAARWHREWLAKGIHVITNNSAALTGDSAEYAKLCAARRASVARYVYGTAYGDWLPVASTVTTLLASGDALQLVEGVLSASVSHVLNALAPDAAAAARADGGGTLAFSKVGAQANVRTRRLARQPARARVRVG